jgi:hypothetical protein
VAAAKPPQKERGRTMSEAQKRARKKYQKNITRLTIDFYPTEKELVEQIEKQPKKQTYIKDLIRSDIERSREK